MKRFALLSLFIVFQTLSAQIPSEIEDVWKGEISTFDGVQVLKGNLEIEINEKKLKNELRFYINKFSHNNLQNFTRLPFVTNSEAENIGFKFNHICPKDANLVVINGEYNFSLKTNKEQIEYLFGIFKTSDNFGAITVLFREKDYKKYKSSKQLNQLIESIIQTESESESESENQQLSNKTTHNSNSIITNNNLQNKHSDTNKIIRLINSPVKLDADKLYKFNDGYAVIQKGKSFALIDATGKIVIPYNIYEFAAEYDCQPGRFSYNVPIVGSSWDIYGFKNGIIIAKELKTQKYGVLNSKLETVIPFVHNGISHCSSEGFISASGKFYDIKGNIVPKVVTDFKIGNMSYKMETYFNFKENPDDLYLVERPIVTSEEMEKTKNYTGKFIGYSDRFGNIKIPAIYLRGNPFSEGLAAVSKYDEFGVEKWGFINTKGEVVIDFKFSKRPSIFNEGLALVEPASNTEFDYAYIDKTGEPILKINKNGNCSYLPVQLKSRRPSSITLAIYLYESSFFHQGYSIWTKSCRNDRNKSGTVFLDKNGNEFHLRDMLKNNGYSIPGSLYTDIINHEFIVTGEFNKGGAIANIKGEIIIKTPYGGNETGTIHSLFDPISNLTLVSLKKNGKERYGYANRSGEIIITLAEKGTW